MVTVTVEVLTCVVVSVERSVAVCVTVTNLMAFWPTLKDRVAAMIITSTIKAAKAALSPLLL